jgi:hypothetical protein
MPAQVETIRFEEEQSFRQPWIWALMIGMFAILVFAFGMVLFQPPTPAKGGTLSAIIGLSVGVVVYVGVAALMYSLTLRVQLDGDTLRVRFRPLASRDIPLGEIARWEARTYRPLLEYGGWGIRCGWKGMAYNVSGNRGVQLELTNGKRILIGSQRADELADAITQAKGG